MNEQLLESLRKMARRETWFDDEDSDDCVYDFCGGNVDDAYSGGQSDGETGLARAILIDLGETW